LRRKKDFLIVEDIEGDLEHDEIPIIRFKLQDANEEKDSIKLGKLKADPIKIKGKIPDINGLLDKDEIELEIKASPDDWEKLYILGISDPQKLGQTIFLNFAEPVWEYINRDKARAMESAFMRDSRQYVAAVYVVALHWRNHPPEKWPNFFRETLCKFDKSEITNPKTGQLTASKIAHQCWEELFEERREKLKLDAKEDRLDFKETYLDKNSYINPARDYFQKYNHTPTIETILNFLKQLP